MTTIEVWTGETLEPMAGVAPHTFTGGEPHLNFAEEHGATGAHAMVTVRSGGFAQLGEALVHQDALRRAGAASVSLFLPYLPAARQDRGIPFTAQVVADVINHARFDRVIAVDPHSPVMPSLLERFEEIDAAAVVPASLFEGIEGQTFSVIAPDSGARDRASAVADRFGLPVVQALKTRDPERNYAVTGYECQPIATDIAVVIDDICDGGGTFLALAEALGIERERLRLWTTHGIYARGLEDLSARYSTIAATDSLDASSQAHVVEPLRTHLISHLRATT